MLFGSPQAWGGLQTTVSFRLQASAAWKSLPLVEHEQLVAGAFPCKACALHSCAAAAAAVPPTPAIDIASYMSLHSLTTGLVCDVDQMLLHSRGVLHSLHSSKSVETFTCGFAAARLLGRPDAEGAQSVHYK